MKKGQIRQSELHKRRKRREATQRLRIKYLQAKTDEERNEILNHLMRVNPYITVEHFLQPIKNKLNKLKEKAE